ncbi:MAG TPA: disulfide bond formation protein B [Burkholderiaceae bacterium]|nr:disulfide bond formation protein B [Burkholderiaceae bacterium]
MGQILIDASGPGADSRDPMNPNTQAKASAWALVFAGWVVATASTLGALFFSEVLELPPCLLCWYQRIFMFPLVLLLPIGLFPFDPKVVRYALPLSLLGTVVAAFHVLLVAGVVPESVTPCSRGVPCSEVQIAWFGFVSIPVLAVLAFTLITLLLVVAHLRTDK